MSGGMNSSGTPYESSSSLPGWIVSGVLGLTIGAAATVLGMYGYGYRLPETAGDKLAPVAGIPMPTMAPPAGMSGPGGSPMGMGGMGGGGAGKRNLAALVGKLELLSRPSLNLHLDLRPSRRRNSPRASKNSTKPKR